MASTVLTIIGTRPEAIKMSPVLRLLGSVPSINSLVCVTAQQETLLPQTLSHLCIESDYILERASNRQLISTLVAALDLLDPVLTECTPDLVLVQGDTTSTLAGALAASYCEIPVGHVEAGLRTGDLAAPFPEEINRQVVSRVARYHFATTPTARDNLLNEGIQQDDIRVTGSTVIDALQFALSRIKSEPNAAWMETIPDKLVRRISNTQRPLVLVTSHRRENLRSGIVAVCKSLLHVAERHKNWDFVFPVHPNPDVRMPVFSMLGERENIFLTQPMNYTEFVFVMSSSSLIITDSGGIQEEAPYLGIPLLVTRDCTERTEGIDAGVAKIVGSHPARLTEIAEQIVCAGKPNPQIRRQCELYGDGNASGRVVDAIVDLLQNRVIPDIAV